MKKFKIGDYVFIDYIDGYGIGIISPSTSFKNGKVEELWVYPLFCNSYSNRWINDYIRMNALKKCKSEVAQFGLKFKLIKNKSELIVELI